MSLEQKVKEQPKFVIHKTPSVRVLDEIKHGRKFIIVDDDFSQSFIPLGYMLIDMRYKDESFKTLVPQNLLYYLANPGEGDVDDALDEIADFYKEIEDYEDDKLEENGTSVQGTNWAVTSRNAFQTYLINKLTRAGADNPDVPEWNDETIKELNLDDDYVAKRVRAIAALCLGKTAESDLKKYDLGDVVKHVTVNERKVEQLSGEEFDKVTCWARSHYDIKEEYRHKPYVEYRIDRRHDQSHKVGEKISHKREALVLDSRIDALEGEIATYREKKNAGNGGCGRHDRQLLRMYANINYVAKENASKQLEIKPDTSDVTIEQGVIPAISEEQNSLVILSKDGTIQLRSSRKNQMYELAIKRLSKAPEILKEMYVDNSQAPESIRNIMKDYIGGRLTKEETEEQILKIKFSEVEA